jgi:multidrug efflux pump
VISRFFIDRPIFAAVLSIVITLTGAIAYLSLPVAQYPRIVPPSVVVSISYPGANAQVVADTVAAPIEQQVNGVQGMLYMSSQSGNDGSYSLTVTFDIGTDLNTALLMVQNRVTLAMQQLPSSVQNQGITIRKKTPDILMIVSFYSPDRSRDDLYLSNYATINIKDELLRVDGVSDVTYQGQRDYSIRAWLDPQQLASRNMTAIDVATAIKNQNLDAPVGQIGQAPALPHQAFELPIHTLGRLTDPEQFGDIVVKIAGGPPAPKPAAVAPAPASGGSTPLAGPLTSLPPSSSTTTSGTTDNTAPASGTTDSSSSSDASTTDAAPPAIATTGGAATGGGASTGGGANSMGGGAAGGGGTTGGAATRGLPSLGGPTSGGPSAPPALPTTSIVRLRDVARIELGATNYNQACTFDGQPSVGLSVYQYPGTNALDVADRVRDKMLELKTRFPDGVDYIIAYDTTPFIRESVNDVKRTLLEAVVLVGLVVMLFLQNWRAVVIPLIAVPVAIVGTFAVMAALGFSLNNISLFGLVLAIGIVVDDAIVVVENVERWLEHGLPPREATRKAMEEVTSPVIAVALVLCAVFVPCAFIPGITGQFFRQFAVTIAVSTVFSAINSLTLSPALAAILLRPRGGKRDPLTWLLDTVFGRFFALFNRAFGAGTEAYAWVVRQFVRVSLLVVFVYGGLLVLTYWVFGQAPTGFIPQQDQGRLIVNVQLPDASSLQRTQIAAAEVERIARGDKNDPANYPGVPGVAHTVTMSGTSFLLGASSPNFASMFLVLDDFDKRQSPELSDTAIIAELRRKWAAKVTDAVVTVYPAAPIPGLGTAGGYKLVVEDRGGLGLPTLQSQTEALVRKISAQPGLAGATSPFRSGTPQLFLDIDRAKVASHGVPLNDVNQTLDMYLGSVYVNSFNEFGRHWQVTIQAESRFRDQIEDIGMLQIRNQTGQMVPLGTLVTPREIGGPISVTRYNLYTAAAVNGNMQPGISTGDAIDTVNQLAATDLPLSMKAEWTDIMFMQIRAGNTAMYVFALAVISVFLALAALYESWTLPLAVILVVPLCLLCSVVGVMFTHRDVNIFVQIGFVVLVGLACKNAILIVEFARQLHQDGKPLAEATVEASRLRLRPILMTSFAFIFGVVPLVIASGAGAEMRRSLGTAVFSGMVGVTFFGILLTPVFFYVIQSLGDMQLFLAQPALRWIGSGTLGGLLGLASGFLLGKLGVVRLSLAMPLGACIGALAVLAVLGIHRLVQPRSPVAYRQGPTSPGEGVQP